MAARKSLRAVAVGEKAQPKAPTTVAEASSEGTARQELVALRARIAKAIDDPNIRGADLASLSRRLLEIRKEIDAIDAREEQEATEDAAEVEDGDFDAASV
jgi:hypothetical protein